MDNIHRCGHSCPCQINCDCVQEQQPKGWVIRAAIEDSIAGYMCNCINSWINSLKTNFDIDADQWTKPKYAMITNIKKPPLGQAKTGQHDVGLALTQAELLSDSRPWRFVPQISGKTLIYKIEGLNWQGLEEELGKNNLWQDLKLSPALVINLGQVLPQRVVLPKTFTIDIQNLYLFDGDNKKDLMGFRLIPAKDDHYLYKLHKANLTIQGQKNWLPTSEQIP